MARGVILFVMLLLLAMLVVGGGAMVLIVRTPAHDRVMRGGIEESEEIKREGGLLRRDMVRGCIVRMLENGGVFMR